jgi:hypothetical protein
VRPKNGGRRKDGERLGSVFAACNRVDLTG